MGRRDLHYLGQDRLQSMCSMLLKSPITYVQMISILLWWKYPAFLDYSVPAVVCTVFVDFRGHVGYGSELEDVHGVAGNWFRLK